MINTRAIRPAKLSEIQENELFVPVVADGDRFLVGHINEYAIAITLDGSHPFASSDIGQWNRAPGIAIGNIDFEVEEASGSNVRSYNEASKGDLIIDGDRLAVVGREKMDTYPVWLRGDPKKDVERGIAFSEWRIVLRDGNDKQVLFEKAATPEE